MGCCDKEEQANHGKTHDCYIILRYTVLDEESLIDLWTMGEKTHFQLFVPLAYSL